MGDLRNVLEGANWTRRQETLVSALAAADGVSEFDEMAENLSGDSLLKRIRDRGDAIVMAKVLNHGGEDQQWVENFADAILRRCARMRLEHDLNRKARNDPSKQGDRPPKADHS